MLYADNWLLVDGIRSSEVKGTSGQEQQLGAAREDDDWSPKDRTVLVLIPSASGRNWRKLRHLKLGSISGRE